MCHDRRFGGHSRTILRVCGGLGLMMCFTSEWETGTERKEEEKKVRLRRKIEMPGGFCAKRVLIDDLLTTVLNLTCVSLFFAVSFLSVSPPVFFFLALQPYETWHDKGPQSPQAIITPCRRLNSHTSPLH